jgi:hypothetical protein
MTRIEVGIVLRVTRGSPPIIIGAIADDELLQHALRVAIDAAVRREAGDGQSTDLLTTGPQVLM